MIVNEPKSYRHNDENMLPMINIVFLLLIFFMLAGAISAADRFKIKPTEVAAAEQTLAGNSVLLLGRNGRLAIGAEELTLIQLTARFKAVEKPLEQALQLKVDADTPSATLFDVLRALNAAGVEKVRLLATSK